MQTRGQTDNIKNLVSILDKCNHTNNISLELIQNLEYRLGNCDKCVSCIHPHLMDFMGIVSTQHSLPDLNALLPPNCSSCDTILPERNPYPFDWQYRPSRSLNIATTVTDGDEEQEIISDRLWIERNIHPMYQQYIRPRFVNVDITVIDGDDEDEV
jgi:hypothetical protein